MLDIHTIPVTTYEQNARVLVDTESHVAVVVDPGGEVDAILAQVPDHVRVSAIWITHSHIDHVSGVAPLLDQLTSQGNDAPMVVAHPEDAVNREALPMQASMMGFPFGGDFSVTQSVVGGDTVMVGRHAFRVLETPGHAIGHVSFFTTGDDNNKGAPVLIAGDALFKGSIGRTDLPGGNHHQLLTSIHTHLFALPDHTVVCPGHREDTTIGYEKRTNPFFQ